MDLALHLLAHAIFIGLAWHFGRRFEARAIARRHFDAMMRLPTELVQQITAELGKPLTTEADEELDFNLHRKGPG